MKIVGIIMIMKKNKMSRIVLILTSMKIVMNKLLTLHKSFSSLIDLAQVWVKPVFSVPEKMILNLKTGAALVK